MVTSLTKEYYTGDLHAPGTKSQVLRALKFAVLYCFIINAVFFLYGFAIPLIEKPPYYGGLDPRNFRPTQTQLVVMVVCLLLPLIRLMVMSWSVHFYQYGLLLFAIEALCLVFVALFWSPGLPVLLTLFLCNAANIVVNQHYWHNSFVRVAQELKALVPPAAHGNNDSTELQVFPGWTRAYWEFQKLWGLAMVHTEECDLYDERCGVFSGKDQSSHVEALQKAYLQAINPEQNVVPWPHATVELRSLNMFGLFDGVLNTFIFNAAYGFAGLWLGKALFEDWSQGWWALVCAVVMVGLYLFSFHRTRNLLEEAMGVAVAEKEWLANDIVRHQGEREEMLHSLVDITPGHWTMTKAELVEQDFYGFGRLNLTFMWLCAAAAADFIGESYLSRLYGNLALETRYMLEAMTPYAFKLFSHAKWQISLRGILMQQWVTLTLTFMTTVYFGSYFHGAVLPEPLIGCFGVACFIVSVSKAAEIMQYTFTILGAGKTTNRHGFVSESIVIVVFMAVLMNVLIWLYLVPIMKNWDLPVGGCSSWLNNHLFPGACWKR